MIRETLDRMEEGKKNLLCHREQNKDKLIAIIREMKLIKNGNIDHQNEDNQLQECD